jgi:hypothetical protein
VKRTFATVIALALAISPLVTVAAEAGLADFKSCTESRRRVSRLEASGVSCRTARWVARRFDEKVTNRGAWPSETAMPVGRFRCRARQTGYETYRIRCRRGPNEIVRFDWGV